MTDDQPERPLGAWLRQAHPAAPVEIVTLAGAAQLSVRQWLQLVEDGTRFFGPQLRAALLTIPDPE